MPKICYKKTRFNPATLLIIEQANLFIEDYATQGYILTLRQLYYRFIATDTFPRSWIDVEYNRRHRLPDDTKNTLKNYKRFGSIISKGRIAGLIDWSAIEDRVRNLQSNSHWGSGKEILSAAAESFAFDKWAVQEYRPEVYIEKEALIGIIEPICRELDVSYFACKGYNSQSEMWRSAQRIQGIIDAGQIPIIFHLGDHDPSGIDMTRDIRDRLDLFIGEVEVKRLALTWDQVQQYNAPPNPSKNTDPRFESYLEQFGNDCWELDALEPSVIVDLIEDAVTEIRDVDLWDEQVEREEKVKKKIAKFAKGWKD